MATVKCPHCGALVTTGVSPWTIIGWIAVVLLVLFLGTCALLMKGIGDAANARNDSSGSPALSSAAPARANPRIKVEFECRRSDGGMAFVDGTVRNVGSESISAIELHVSFRDEHQGIVGRGDGYADIQNLAPGQSSTFKALGRDYSYHSCQIDQANTVGGEAIDVEF